MEPPERIGPYEVLREIGRGGMGIVYLAREPDEGSLLALKVLPGDWTNDDTRLKRFQREAATVMKVPHPNIVPIYSIGRAGGVWFIAMKFIEGTSLDRLIHDHASEIATVRHQMTELSSRTGPVMVDRQPPTVLECDPAPAAPCVAGTKDAGGPSTGPEWVYRSVQIVEKVARALAHVHGQGIVHRDIKPGNILIDKTGDAWLADFGLVREVDTSMSQAEGILGTVQYMAPEQIKTGRTGADHRSDLYALGVTLYELVTLKRPFEGPDVTSTLFAVAREAPVPPRKLNPNLTDDLERVIQKAMAKDPDARYQTGTAFADDLRRVRTFEPVLASRPPVFADLRRLGSNHPLVVAVTSFLVVVVMALAGYCVRNELREGRRLAECRAEADEAYGRGRFADAAESYRLYLRLGGDDAVVRERLSWCREAIEAASKK
jgi:serine/threonine protein kinase